MYRKIYEQNYGPIPVDNDGRTYDIHHIDGNRKNNDPSNLVALSIEEHYKVHYNQGEFNACLRIMTRKNVSPDFLSDLAKKDALKRLEEGRCLFQNKEFIENHKKIMKNKYENGTHPSQRQKQKDIMSSIAKEFNVKRAYDWEIVYPNGESKVINNLNQFCKDNGLNSGNMSLVAAGKIKQHKGYSCRRVSK